MQKGLFFGKISKSTTVSGQLAQSNASERANFSHQNDAQISGKQLTYIWYALEQHVEH
jgi:hypothetical protein